MNTQDSKIGRKQKMRRATRALPSWLTSRGLLRQFCAGKARCISRTRFQMAIAVLGLCV